MKASNNTTYPIFEADQVLTQKQLNTVVSYLEEQDRLTRTGVIGVGTICGMEVTFPDFNSINIACGTAITSLGFEINWEEKNFSFYRDYELPGSFLHPDISNESFLKPIFDQADRYTVFNDDTKPIKELVYVSDQDLSNNRIPDGAIGISNATFYNNKVVMILLEASLIDIENCVSTSCDDSGKKMEFTLRPLLVDVSLIREEFKNDYISAPISAPLYLKRFDVPQTNLTTGQQILNAFYALLNKDLVDGINSAVNSAYMNFKPQYEKLVPHYKKLKDPGVKIKEIIQAYRSSLAIQYVYAWAGDIINAYNEIYYFEEEFSLKNCCSAKVDELFPFHVFLGLIKTQTMKSAYPGQLIPQSGLVRKGFFPNQYNTLDTNHAYITPWLKISASGQDGQKNTMAMLLERLAYIIDSFYVPDNYATMEVKITPSKYGDYMLSQKAIPYYYDINQVPFINQVWNPSETQKGRNNYILSYNSKSYTSSLPVIQPLEYSFEKYNFFRVEGHIGQPYDQVVIKLNDIKNANRLPINIIALNAVDVVPGGLDMAKYKGDWGSLQLDYEIVSRHWEDTIGKCLEWWYPNQYWVRRYINSSEIDYFIKRMAKVRNYTRKYFSDFLPHYYSFVLIYEEIEEQVKFLRDRLFREISEIYYNDKGEPYTIRPFDAYTEEIIDRLDDIINVRSLGQFRALYQNAQLQWKTISQAITLKTFMNQNPGIQSGNGVPVGGTLILLYQDTAGLLEELGQPVKKKSNVPDLTIQEFNNSLTVYANSVLDRASFLQIKEYSDKYIYTNSIRDTSVIPNKAVIADFFLPYIYSGGGTAINFIVNPPDFTPKGTADFSKPDFSTPDIFSATNPYNEQ